MRRLSETGPETGRPLRRAIDGLRSRKNRASAWAHLVYDRLRQLFALPGCYRRIRAFEAAPRSRFVVARDLLTLFFSYKTFPDHYGPCHLWEVDRKDWGYYYGSNYHPHQQARLRKAVQPPEYRVLFNDKYLTVLLCRALGIRIPETRGVIGPADTYREQLREWLDSSPAGALIVKPLCGEMGRGILKATKVGPDMVVRSATDAVPLGAYVQEGRSIVQDVLGQDPRMAALSPHSVNTIRVVTLIDRAGGVIIANASLRCGVGTSFIDNFSAGGVSAGIDLETGRLKKLSYDNAWKTYAVHPTTGLVFADFVVPEWPRILEAARSIQRSFSFYRLLGLDIAIDVGGRPVLIEINGAPDLVGLEQKAGPLLRREPVLRAFGDYGLLINKHQRRLYANLMSGLKG